MPTAPKVDKLTITDEITIPGELLEQLEELPIIQKELATESLRFVVFLIMLVLLFLINLFSPYIPFLATIPPEQIQVLGWQIVISGLGFIAARTIRPGKTPAGTNTVEGVVNALSVFQKK